MNNFNKILLFNYYYNNKLFYNLTSNSEIIRGKIF